MRKILGIILARGGSKSIPKKSIYPCAGKPLLFYTIKAVQASRRINRTIISTDDQEIADIAKKENVEVLFLRPRELAQDHTPDLPVLQHALGWLKEHENYVPDAIVHLRPTTPLKSARDLDRAVDLLLENPEADSVRSVCEPLHTPFKMYRLEGKEKFLKPILAREYPETFAQYAEPFNMPRQVLPKVWRHSGYADVIRPEVIMKKSSMSGTNILPLFFDEWRDIDIDSFKELKYAEEVIHNLNAQGENPWD